MNAPAVTGSAEARALAAAERPTVLCVDDEPNILAALRRTLRALDVVVVSATGGDEALELLDRVQVDVVVSDMRMPGIDGAQLLEQVHERWPQTARILLTGYADTASAAAAINRGRIFRYLQKPWHDDELRGAVHEGLERIALQRERDRLLELTKAQNGELQALNTTLEARVEARTADLAAANDKLQRRYLKTVKVFSNLLELRSGLLAGHGRRVADTARDVARAMALPEEQVLQIFVAGLLHDVGMIGLDDRALAKPFALLTPEERTIYQEHPLRAEQSLLALDDMQPLLPLIRSHHERFDGQGYPDALAGSAIPLGARILAVADAFDELQSTQLASVAASREEARKLMRAARGTQFDPEVLDVFLQITEPAKPKAQPSLVLPTESLEADMVLSRDLVSARGVLMLTAGHRLSASLITRIREFEHREGGKLQIHIRPRP